MPTWLHRWFLLRGPWDVSTSGGTQADGYIPRVFCLLRWAQVDIEGDLEAQQEIEAMYSLKAFPQHLDINVGANLRVCGLDPPDDEGAISEAQIVMAFVQSSSLIFHAFIILHS